jgi:hypothetical protein
MKSKTLISMAIASTFGLSTAAFAGNGHEVMTPYQPNEGGYVSLQQHGFGSDKHMQSFGSTGSEAGGSVAGGSTHDSFSSSFDQSASMSDGSTGDTEDWMALGEDGSYSNYYLVGIPSTFDDSWDYYLIDTGSEELASADEVLFLAPTYDVVVIESMSDDVGSGLGE